MRSTHRLTRLVAALATGIVVPSIAAPLVLGATAAHAAPSAGTYTIAAGDSLYGVARRHGVSLAELLAVNGLSIDSVILPGRVLTLPAGATVAAAPATTATPAPVSTGSTGAPAAAGSYTIRSGDYFYGIARRHGVSLTALLAANNLTPTSIVHPGTTIVIPAGGRPQPATPTASVSNAATTAPRSAAPAAGGAPATTHTVQQGEGFFAIATRYGVSLTALLDANTLTIHSIVHPGTTITIPAGGRTPAPTTAPVAQATALTPAAATPAAPATAPAVSAQNASPAPSGSSKADAVVAFAWAQLGKPYRFAAAGPDAFDCSGLTTAAYRQVGVFLPQQSGMQSVRGTAVDWTTEDIRPGDLVFTIRSGTSDIGHVGIAISATQWIHAPRAGDVVKLGTIPSDARIAAVRRFV